MRIIRLIVPATLALSFAGCSKDNPTAPSATAQREAAANALADMSVKIADPQAKKVASEAALALGYGAPISSITVTTSTLSASRGSVVNARVAADIGGGAEEWQATALQVVIQNSSTSAANGTYNTLVMWKGTSDLVFVGVPASASSPTAIGLTGTAAFGGLFTAPSAAWQATSGTASISGTGSDVACTSFPTVSGLTCTNATFTGGFSITHSTPFTGGGTNTATGDKTAALTSRSFDGIRVVVNCSTLGC